MARKITRADEDNVDARPRTTGGSAATEAPVTVPQGADAGLAEHEKWLYENPEALASVKRGLEDLAAGRTHKRRSYADYANTPAED